MTLVSILRDLLRSPSSDIDAGVELALGQLCPVLGGGRAWLFTADSAGGLHNTHASADEPLARGDVLPADATFAAPWLEALGQGRPVVVPDISALPERLFNDPDNRLNGPTHGDAWSQAMQAYFLGQTDEAATKEKLQQLWMDGAKQLCADQKYDWCPAQ